MWFKKLTGFTETSPENVKMNIRIEGNTLISKTNGKSYQFGALEILSLAELKKLAPSLENYKDRIKVSEIVADVQKLHCDLDNEKALFQAASQFNLLEMVSPNVTPEQGVTIYERDFTQGPACAIACGAGTIYRNYFVPVGEKIGQTSKNQIDCLEAIGKALKNEVLDLWEMKNGYALLNQEGLLHINNHLKKLNPSDKEQLRDKLKIGVQWQTQVTIMEKRQIVSQAYCSALPVAYSPIDSYYWESFAKLILVATYEATLYAALINLEKYGSNKVFLTLIGGGVFGNDISWIIESLISVIDKFKHTPLDIKIVSYGRSNALLKEAIASY